MTRSAKAKSLIVLVPVCQPLTVGKLHFLRRHRVGMTVVVGQRRRVSSGRHGRRRRYRRSVVGQACDGVARDVSGVLHEAPETSNHLSSNVVHLKNMCTCIPGNDAAKKNFLELNSFELGSGPKRES